MYTNLDFDGFPATHAGPIMELVNFRSWQGPFVTKIFYYAALIFVVVTNCIHIIGATMRVGWEGFLLTAAIALVAIPIAFLLIRLLAEIILSIFLIRKNSSNFGSSGGNAAAAAPSALDGFSSPFDKGNSFSGSAPSPSDDGAYQQV